MSDLKTREYVSRLLIKKAVDEFGEDKCAVACSFGKDSEVVLHLCLQEAPKINVVFCNTGIEFKDTLEFRDRLVKEWNLNFHEARPETNFGALVRKYGLPTVRTNGTGRKGPKTPYCCIHLKEKPADKMYKSLGIKCVFTGMTSEESRNRFMLNCRMGDYYFAKSEGRTKCHPIINWPETIVWEYIKAKNLPYNSHYDKFPGHRVGCAACTAYNSWMERMPLESPKWYQWVQKIRGQTLFDMGEA